MNCDQDMLYTLYSNRTLTYCTLTIHSPKMLHNCSIRVCILISYFDFVLSSVLQELFLTMLQYLRSNLNFTGLVWYVAGTMNLRWMQSLRVALCKRYCLKNLHKRESINQSQTLLCVYLCIQLLFIVVHMYQRSD